MCLHIHACCGSQYIQGQLESLTVVLHHHLRKDACFKEARSCAACKAVRHRRNQRNGRHEEQRRSKTSVARRDRQELIIDNPRPCWENMGTWRLKQHSQRWRSGGVCGHRITVKGLRNSVISWRSAGFGMSLSAFLNNPQSDGHFEVPQSCLNPAWIDAENRKAERKDRNIQREWRGRMERRIDDGRKRE